MRDRAHRCNRVELSPNGDAGPERERRNNTAELVRRVVRGERLHNTEHGHPVAELGSIVNDDGFAGRDELIAYVAGLLAADTRRGTAPNRLGARRSLR